MEGEDLALALLVKEKIVEQAITIFEDEANIEAEINEEDEVNVGRHEDDKFAEPKCGMAFPDLDALYNYWKAYGSEKGFPVRKRTSKRRDGVVSLISYMCSLGGKPGSESSNPLKLQSNTRLGCTVKLSAHLNVDGQWHITVLNLQHNHALSPSKSRYFRHNRFIPASTRRRLELNDRAGIRANQNIRACIEESGGYENATYMVKDARNYIDKARHLRLGQGDAMAIQNYFLKMQAQSPCFFFSMDIDEVEGRLRNVFWADARSREAYKEFGRVVTFDTTYLVDKYDMSFVPFVGVNHHGQSVLPGRGLISSEKTETFCWLFQTWLTCMSGCAPEGIITDQDKAMQNAIEIVFPNTRHRFCGISLTRFLRS